MSSPKVIKAADFDPSKLKFSDCKIDDNGRKLVYVNSNNAKVRLQTPRMKLPFGCKKWGKNESEFSFELEMSFSGSDSNPELQIFKDKLEEFDNIVLDKIIENGSSWLSRPKLTKDVIEAAGLYNPTLRVSKDKTTGENLPYPNRFKVKLDRNRDAQEPKRFVSDKKYKNSVLFYDSEKQQMDISEENAEQLISKGSEMVAVVELVYLSISKTVSAKFKLVQARVFENKDYITSNIMLDDDEETSVVSHSLENMTLQKDLDNEFSENDTSLAIDEEEIEEEEEEELYEEDTTVLPILPSPSPVKKATRAKKTTS
jgi:hypothetical protein